MRKVSVTELCGMAKCERQAVLKKRLGYEAIDEQARRRMESGTAQHKSFEREDLGGQRCFVASWACGPEAGETEWLRSWRDRSLLPNRAGRIAVKCYYALSPLLIRGLRLIPGARLASGAAVRLCAKALGWRGQ